MWHLAQVREGALLGENCIIGRGAYVGPEVRMGDNCKLQNYALVYEPAVLEDGVFVGPAVVFTNDHYPRSVAPDGTIKRGDDWEAVGVTCREGSSIGARSVCVAPVTIGRWALVDATPLGGTDAVTATAGPFAVTLYEPSTWTPSADPLDAYFACGQAPTVREDTLPDVAGLMLAADVPADGWSSSAEPPGWTATLTGADERTVSGQAAVTAKLVFVGSDGLTAGMEVSGDFEWLPFSVSSGHPTALPAGGEPNRCEGGALASADIAMPPGTYTAWPVVTVSVDSVTHPDGSTDPAPTGDRIVVGFPTQVTFTD